MSTARKARRSPTGRRGNIDTFSPRVGNSPDLAAGAAANPVASMGGRAAGAREADPQLIGSP